MALIGQLKENFKHMHQYPKQRISTSKKNKQWRIDTVNYIINHGLRDRYNDIHRMLKNYAMLNSDLDQEEYREICSSLGVRNVDDGKKFVQAYNKVHNVYSTLKGEELGRPFNYRVANLAPSTSNEITREMDRELFQYVNSRVERDIALINESIKQEQLLEQGKTTFTRAKSSLENKRRELERKYSYIDDPKNILKKYTNYQTSKEKTMNKLMRMLERRLKVKWIKNETFGDVIATGTEFVELIADEKNIFPKVKQLNPVNMFYHKSPDVAFVQYSDYVGYMEELTIGEILDTYGDKLSNEDIRRLETFNYDGSGMYGTSDSLFHTRSDRKADSWHAKRDAGLYPSGRDIDPYGLFILDGKYQAIPGAGHVSYGSSIFGRGLYQNDYHYNRPYGIVYTVYWMSYRRIIKYNWIDKNGEKHEKLVDDSFVIPDNANKEVYEKNMFGKDKERHVWYENDLYRSAEIVWIPEPWKGVRINGDIFPEIGPVQHAYQSLLNPYKSKLPIYGAIYNARNAPILCTLDKVSPWQKFYYSIMGKLLKMMSQDRGILTFLNTYMTDKELGLEETLRIAEDIGLIPYNPLSRAKGAGGLHNTMKVAERIDASNAQVITHYIQLLQFAEQNIKEAAGMSDIRLAQVSSSNTATEATAATQASLNITEPMFAIHDLLWEDIMQGLMEMTLSVVNENTGKLRGFLNDDELGVIDLEELSLEDEFLLSVSNNGKNFKLLRDAQTFALTLMQTDKAKFSTVIRMMETEDLAEFKEYVDKMEAELEEKEMRMQQMQEDAKRERIEYEVANREDIQKSKLDQAYLEGLIKEKLEHIRGRYMVTSYNLQHDVDQDGIPDIMEQDRKYQELLTNIGRTAEDVRLRQEEHDLKRKAHEDKVQIDREKMLQDERLEQEELDIKRKQVQAQSDKTKNND